MRVTVSISELKGSPKTFKGLAGFPGGADKAWLEESAFPRPGSAVSALNQVAHPDMDIHERDTHRPLETDFAIKMNHGGFDNYDASF